MNYELYIVKLNPELDLSPYDHWFSKSVLEHIYSYKYQYDQLRAFTSALLKYYFLPYVLGLSPVDIIIKETDYGKPYVDNYDEINFSISHSGEFVVFAIAYGAEIGVDIEFIDRGIDLNIGSIVFNNNELIHVKDIDDFYILWTKKEAYLKCVGSGFTSDSYKYTQFNNEQSQLFLSYNINCCRWRGNYFLSVCISKDANAHILKLV